MAGFEELRIWKDSHQLKLIVHGIANKLPAHEVDLKNQIKRSSSSVPNNISEGYSSYYYNDKLKGVYVARKEAGETQNHIRSFGDQHYISQNQARELIDRYESVIRGINSYAKYIASKRDKKK